MAKLSDLNVKAGTVTSLTIVGTDGIEVDSGSPATGDGSIQLGIVVATMQSTLGLDSAAYEPTSSFDAAGTGASAAAAAVSAHESTYDHIKIATAIQPADIGTAAYSATTAFATAAQGALADSAVQPGDIGTAAAEDVGYFATAAQGALADSALQSGAAASSIDFGTGTDGYAWTSDGAGGAAWEVIPGTAAPAFADITGSPGDNTNLASALAAKEDLLGFTAVPDTLTINGYDLTGNVTLTQDDIGDGSTYVRYDSTNVAITGGQVSGTIVVPRVSSATSSATPTPDCDSYDISVWTALAADATFGAPSGTPYNGQRHVIRVKDDGTARALGFNSIYRASSDLALPTTTTLSKTLYMGFMYNSADSKWDLLALLDNF